MKTILVPIDFSAASDNALNYAVEFAKKNQAQIHLFHVYDYSQISSDPMTWVPVSDEYVHDLQKNLESVREKIYRQYGKEVKVKIHLEPGTVIEAVNEFAREKKADLIIMGMQGGGYVTEKIIGSTAASLMRQSVCPVLGIAQGVKYHPVLSIVLATDYQDADYESILKPLKDLIQIFDAHLYVLYVVEPGSISRTGIAKGDHISRALKEIPYTIHTLAGGDFAAAVNEFIEDKAIDMAVTIPRKHTFVYSLFHEANTKKLAFHLSIPLLTLHE
jgi:nucleotide-binding universal stress UspA family protein